MDPDPAGRRLSRRAASLQRPITSLNWLIVGITLGASSTKIPPEGARSHEVVRYLHGLRVGQVLNMNVAGLLSPHGRSSSVSSALLDALTSKEPFMADREDLFPHVTRSAAWGRASQDSSRRAHSIAAQGGIDAAKNYRADGDSVWRLFYDTLEGGDFRSRKANVYRLAQLSGQIIDQCAAQGVPFARECGGVLATRSFGGALVSKTFYARGQTGQQLLLGAYQALERQVQ